RRNLLSRARSPRPWSSAAMSNAFAPRPFDEFEDELDLDMDYETPAPAPSSGPQVPAAPQPSPIPDEHSPLRFTSPVEAQPAAPSQVPAAPEFNPVGELVAGAAAAFSAPVPGGHAAEVSVPRIAIHVFAERQDTLAAAERAGQDRRL